MNLTLVTDMSLIEFNNAVKAALIERYDADPGQVEFMMMMWPTIVSWGYVNEDGPLTIARELMDEYLAYDPNKERRKQTD